MKPSVIALLHGPDQPGIVAKVATWIHQRGGNVLHADQHLDRQENVFFQRVEWEPDADRNPREESDEFISFVERELTCLLYTSPSPRDLSTSRMPSSA